MPKVSGLIVRKLCHTRHDGNIRCLEPVAPCAHHHDYGSGEYEEAPDKEEPPGVVTEIAAINTLNMAEEVAHLEAKGIIHAIRCLDDMQEASGAYKDIEEVIANELDLIRWVLKIPTS